MANQANIKAVITAEDRASGALTKFGNNVEAVGSKVSHSLKTAAVAFATAATAAAGFAVKSAADFEQTRVGLENMLGSADRARKLLGEISKFAAETPFEFPELAQATRQLVAFGFSADDAFNTMKQLGDVSAAVGAPINDLAYLMGTLRAQGRAFTIDIRQFAMRGIPIYEYLGKVLGKNTQQITEMIEAGKIGFPEVQKAFQRMTAEGGAFHGTMAKQSKTLSGLFSTLKDNIGQTARELVGITQTGDVKAGSLFDKLRIGVDQINKTLPNLSRNIQNTVASIVPQLQQWAKNIEEVAIQIGNYLSPKVEALYNSLVNKLIPALSNLWKNILQPLIPIIGTVFVVALGLAVDAINILISAISPLINWLSQNTGAVHAVIGAITVWYGLMKANVAFVTITGFISALNGTLIAHGGVIGATKAAYVGLNNYLVGFAGFAVVAAAASGAAVLIIDSANRARAAWDNAHRSIDSSSASVTDATVRLQALLKQYRASGDKAGEARALRSLQGIAGQRASGGNVMGGSSYLVGEKGPEIFKPNSTGNIIPNNKIGASNSINITIQAGALMGSDVEARKFAQVIINHMKELAGSKNISLQQMLGT